MPGMGMIASKGPQGMNICFFACGLTVMIISGAFCGAYWDMWGDVADAQDGFDAYVQTTVDGYKAADADATIPEWLTGDIDFVAYDQCNSAIYADG